MHNSYCFVINELTKIAAILIYETNVPDTHVHFGCIRTKLKVSIENMTCLSTFFFCSHMFAHFCYRNETLRNTTFTSTDNESDTY